MAQNPLPELVRYPLQPHFIRAQAKLVPPIRSEQLGPTLGSHPDFHNHLLSSLRQISGVYVASEHPVFDASVYRLSARAAKAFIDAGINTGQAKAAVLFEMIRFQGSFYNMLRREAAVIGQAKKWLSDHPQGTVILIRGSAHMSYFHRAVTENGLAGKSFTFSPDHYHDVYDVSRESLMGDKPRQFDFSARLLLARIASSTEEAEIKSDWTNLQELIAYKQRVDILLRSVDFDPVKWLEEELPAFQNDRAGLREKTARIIAELAGAGH